jgi:hypothetical protein
MKRGNGRFELRVVPGKGSQYGVELAEERSGAGSGGRQPAFRTVVRVWGRPFQASLDRVLAAVRAAGARPSDLRAGRKAPFPLDEERGVRLGLLLLAVKPLQKMSRIETIRNATAAMASEEAYYWYAKCSSPRDGARAQKALRILLARE